MKRYRIAALLAVAAVALAAAAPSAHASQGGVRKVCTWGHADGPKTCNCTGLDVDVQVCHSTNVQVRINGGSVGSFSTGQSSSTCASASLPPGTCLWICYRYRCCKDPWYWGGGWSCTYAGGSVHSGPAEGGDCG